MTLRGLSETVLGKTINELLDGSSAAGDLSSDHAAKS